MSAPSSTSQPATGGPAPAESIRNAAPSVSNNPFLTAEGAGPSATTNAPDTPMAAAEQVHTGAAAPAGARPPPTTSTAPFAMEQPRWAYSRGQNAVPLRQGPYLDAHNDSPDLRRFSEHRMSTPDSEASHGYESAHEDPFTDARSSTDTATPPRHSAMFMSPQAQYSHGSSLGEEPPTIRATGGAASTSRSAPSTAPSTEASTVPAAAGGAAVGVGGTAATRKAAVAAGYTSPHPRAAPVLSPSQHFQNYATNPTDLEEQRTFTDGAAGADKERYDAGPTRGAAGGFLTGWRKWVLAAVVAAVVLGVALGVGLGVGLNNDSDSDSDKSSGAGSGSSSGHRDTGAPPATPNTTTPQSLTALPRWNWTDADKKAFGVNIGGQFLLERWLYEDWMTEVGGADAWDEWSMSRNLGEEKMRNVLDNHMSTWFVESHLDTLQQAGINMIRIPIGYWPFLSTAETGEPYVNASQLDYLSLALNWAWERKMYVLMDMHGLPGSQNGDQSSGHNMSLNSNGNNDVPWFTPQNQNLSKVAVTNMFEWLTKHPAHSVISGVTTVNEPQTDNGNTTRVSILRDFYRWSIQQGDKYNLPVILHHGFVPEPYRYWDDFMSEQDPSMVIFDAHPYPAWYQNPNPTNETVIIQNICDLGQQGEDFPVPVVMGEWSGVNNVNQSELTTDYLNTQVSTYGWSGGSMFFNYRVNTTQNPVVGPPANIGVEYSLLDMLPQGNAVGQFPIYNGSTSVRAFTNSLRPSCGRAPSYDWTT